MGERGTKAWRKAMLSAINYAAEEGLFAGSSKTDGLRAIRKFEDLNETKFNPLNRYHRSLIWNSGWWFAMQRRLAHLSNNQVQHV